MALSTDILLGVPYNVGGTLREVDASTVVDNVFTFSSNGKKWQRVFDGGNSVYRASWLNITGASTDKTALVAIAVANSAIQTLEIDTTIQIDGAVDFSGKTLSVKSGGLVTGTYAISNAVIEGNLTQKLLDTTGAITASKSATGKWHPTWFGATGDGVTDDYTPVNFTVGVANTNVQKSVSLIQGNYLLGTNLSVPAGVTLEFNKGAYVSGSITISGAGEFDAQNSLAFGGTIVVSGLYPVTGQVSPQMWGAVGDNSTNDAPNINRMFAYVLTIPNNLINVFFPPKRYYISESIYIPNVATQGITIQITGYGSTIRTDQDIVIFYRMPTTNSEANSLINTIFIIKGLRIVGNSSVTVPKTNQIGLLFGALYTSVFCDLQFENIYDGLNLRFALGCEIKNIRVTNQTHSGIVGRYGTWSGATPSNSAFNGNRIINCRVYNRDGAFTSLELLAADQTEVKNFISEGFNPQYNFYYNSMNDPVVNNSFFDTIWLESTSGSVYPKNTNFYIRTGAQVYIKNIQRDYANYLFEVEGLNNAYIVFDGIPFFSASGECFSYSGVNTNNQKFIFKNCPQLFSSFLSDSSRWAGGVIPAYLIEEDGMAIGKRITSNISRINLNGELGTLITNNSGTVAPLSIIGSAPSGSASQVWSISRAITPSSALRTSSLAQFSSERTSSANFIHLNSSNSSNGGGFYIIKSRGTLDSPNPVSNNDVVGTYSAGAYDGTSVIESGMLRFTIDGSVSTGITPTRVRMYLRNSSGNIIEVFGIRSSGQIELAVAPATGTVANSILTLDGIALKQIASTDLIATGAQYQLGYYAAAGNKVSPLTLITGGRALKSDANGLPIAFDTATEPSLAELSYVKGVTSPIQAQLGTKGLYAANGDGVLTTFTVTHGFAGTPTNIQVTPAGVDSAVPFFVNNITATTFDVTFTTPPIVGTDNVTFYWTAK